MSISTAPLPSDFTALRAFAASLQTEIAARDAELYAKTLHIEKLKMQLAELRRARFGRSSEKLDHEIEQLELLIGDSEEGQAERNERTDAAKPASSTASERERLQPVRKPLPDHLPRERVEHEALAPAQPAEAPVLPVLAPMSANCWNMYRRTSK